MRPKRIVPKSIKIRPRKIPILTDKATIGNINRMLSGVSSGLHKLTLIRAINQIKDHPERKKALMEEFLHPAESLIVGQILTLSGRNRLREEDFIEGVSK